MEHSLGHCVDKDETVVLEWCKKAAEKGHPPAFSCMGNIYYGQRNYGEAALWLRKGAEEGADQFSQELLARMYLNGQGVDKAVSEGIRWYQKAAGQGYPLTQYRLGRIYNRGEGVPKNYSEAFRWYKKAADQGLSHAQSEIGVMYLLGEGRSSRP